MIPLDVPPEITRALEEVEATRKCVKLAPGDTYHLERFERQLQATTQKVLFILGEFEQRDLLLHQEASSEPESFTEEKAERLISGYRVLASMLPTVKYLLVRRAIKN